MPPLNADTAFAAREAHQRARARLDDQVQLGVIGGRPGFAQLPSERQNDHLLAAVNDFGAALGYLITAALNMAHGYQLPAEFIDSTAVLRGEPFWFAVGLDLGLARCGSEAVQDVIVEAEQPGQVGAESLAPTAAVRPSSGPAVRPTPSLEPQSVLQRDSTAPGADRIHQVE